MRQAFLYSCTSALCRVTIEGEPNRVVTGTSADSSSGDNLRLLTAASALASLDLRSIFLTQWSPFLPSTKLSYGKTWPGILPTPLATLFYKLLFRR